MAWTVQHVILNSVVDGPVNRAIYTTYFMNLNILKLGTLVHVVCLGSWQLLKLSQILLFVLDTYMWHTVIILYYTDHMFLILLYHVSAEFDVCLVFCKSFRLFSSLYCVICFCCPHTVSNTSVCSVFMVLYKSCVIIIIARTIWHQCNIDDRPTIDLSSWKNFKWPYRSNWSFDSLPVWFCGEVYWVGQFNSVICYKLIFHM